MFKDISVWQCCRKLGQNYQNVGRGGGEYICTQGGKIGSFSTLVHLFRLRLRLYLKHWGINLPVCIQRENAEKHSNVISVTERTEEFTELVLDTVCPSVCLSVAESHGERCVCVCISPLLRERGLLQPNSGSAGPQSCLSHVPDVAMATEDCKTDTHVCVHADTRAHTHTSLPHTHSRSSPAAERCNWNTEELRRGITQHWQNTEDARRERRTEGGEDSRGGRGERERKAREWNPTITCCSWHSQEEAEAFISTPRLYSLWMRIFTITRALLHEISMPLCHLIMWTALKRPQIMNIRYVTDILLSNCDKRP